MCAASDTRCSGVTVTIFGAFHLMINVDNFAAKVVATQGAKANQVFNTYNVCIYSFCRRARAATERRCN